MDAKGHCLAGRTVIMALCVATTPGCSLLFVKGPPSPPHHARVGECTTSRLAPGFDIMFAGLEVVRLGLDVVANDQAFQGAPINRATDIAIGAMLGALFVSSAVYGLSATGRCSDATEDEVAEQQSESDSTRDKPPVAAAKAKESQEVPATARPQMAFDLRAAQSAVLAAFGEAAHTCRLSGKREVTLTYRGDGHVSNVVFEPPFEDAAAGSCAEKSARGASVPAFDGDEFLVRKHIDFGIAERNAKGGDAGASASPEASTGI